MSLQSIMETFRKFLELSLPVLNDVFENDFNDIIDDWLQSNWEIIVEYYLIKTTSSLVVIEPYGNGADCNKHSRRVWEPKYTATHRIMCRINNNEKLIKFVRFVSFEGGGHYINLGPLTHVECEGYILIPYNECVFELEILHLHS